MSLGNYNNSKQKYQDPTVYSGYRFSNPTSKVDATSISCSFWRKSLKISIAPKKKSNDDTIAWDYDNAISIYITHTKARILAEEIKKFIKEPDKYNNVGVNSGSGVIVVANGSKYGTTNPVIIISKIDNETGKTESNIAYETNSDNYHYGLENFDDEKFTFSKTYYNNLELEQLVTLLTQYYISMCGALAYSVVDEMKYTDNKMTNMLKGIAENLGVDTGYKKNNYNSSNSIFNKDNKDNNNNPYSQSSIDDIESQME